ncbi:toll/interleukin-1 receptor domain-containing protein [Brevundimonas sp. GCM10030266]|uniref:toll/interleukin-1 receptor domain-containing protein n=1 Tax=Brevundimonas sp. GCM10030266 TaxID=3273386 RepID=UPI003618B51B
MVEYVTRDELRSAAAGLKLDEQVARRRKASSQTLTGSTFLSHSSKDKDLVLGATILLENHGAKVYLDEIDPAMPPYTNDETARLLKSRIRQTHRFVLLVSPNSKESRWVPWELGVADGYKSLGTIALLPSADDPYDRAWAEWEYLGLYHRIVWGEINGEPKPLWMVLDHRANTATPLRRWLSGG